MPACALTISPRRPERDPFAVREAAALAPRHEPRPRINVGEELGDDAALAETGFADDRDQADGVSCDALVEKPGKQGKVDLATDKRAAVGSGDVRAKAGSRSGRPEDPHGLGLALDRGGGSSA